MKNNKGFTLIEIIVVLVILAILAAATIPSMLGFVQDARKKAMLAEVREYALAAQSRVTEQIGNGTVSLDNTADLASSIEGNLATNPQLSGTLNGDLEGTVSNVVIDEKGKVKSFDYTKGTITAHYADGQAVTFIENGAGVSTEPSAAASEEPGTSEEPSAEPGPTE